MHQQSSSYPPALRPPLLQPPPPRPVPPPPPPVPAQHGASEWGSLGTQKLMCLQNEVFNVFHGYVVNKVNKVLGGFKSLFSISDFPNGCWRLSAPLTLTDAEHCTLVYHVWFRCPACTMQGLPLCHCLQCSQISIDQSAFMGHLATRPQFLKIGYPKNPLVNHLFPVFSWLYLEVNSCKYPIFGSMISH